MIRILSLVVILFLASTLPSKAMTSGEFLSEFVATPFRGDFPEMKKAKAVRVLVPFSVTDYYLDKGHERGLAAEIMLEFEKFLNKGIQKETEKIALVAIPTARDKILPGIIEGHGDIAAADLTITAERSETVDFSDPLYGNVRELVVTKMDVPKIDKLEGLAGMEIHVRQSSSYYASLMKANQELAQQGLDQIKIIEADEWLEDEDLMEMVGAGIVPAIVMDDHKAKLWSKLFEDAKIHDEFALREGGEIAWAFRKNSPELRKTVNAFVAKIREGTKLGNIFAGRYYSDIHKIVNPKTEKYEKTLQDLLVLFEKYGEKYNIDPILLAAQAFQESRFNNRAKSHAGAVGIMQLLPSTARDKNVAIKNFRKLEGNIEAGAKYNRFVADYYFSDESISELNKILFVFASYNAGPNRVARVRKKAKDPNVWFDHVEYQVARAAGAEPIKYVKNIYIYYLLFSEILEYEKRKATE